MDSFDFKRGLRRVLVRWLPRRNRLAKISWLKPFRATLLAHELWRWERHPVALGVAIGLFFGFMIPLGQFVFAAVLAVVLRANIPAAAASTLVTNPFTLPPIYYFAYRIGSRITGGRTSLEPTETAVAEEFEVRPEGLLDGLYYLLDWMYTIGKPLIVGLSMLAIVSSICGYFLVKLAWPVRHVRGGESPLARKNNER